MGQHSAGIHEAWGVHRPMHLAPLLEMLDCCAPLKLAEPWDNVGLLLGRPDGPIAHVLMTIDLTDAVLQEAQEMGAELVIAYHPTWFGPKKRLLADELLYRAARAGIAVYSPHTALDAAPGGTNDVLADAASMMAQGRVPLRPWAPGSPEGMGRVGTLAKPQPFGPWLAHLKESMGVKQALVAHGPALPEGPAYVHKVAVCAGAGDDLLQKACEQKADTYIVGELRHHHALAAVAQNCRVVALLHSGSERAALPFYARRLAKMAPDVTFRVSTTDRDPYAFC